MNDCDHQVAVKYNKLEICSRQQLNYDNYMFNYWENKTYIPLYIQMLNIVSRGFRHSYINSHPDREQAEIMLIWRGTPEKLQSTIVRHWEESNVKNIFQLWKDLRDGIGTIGRLFICSSNDFEKIDTEFFKGISCDNFVSAFYNPSMDDNKDKIVQKVSQSQINVYIDDISHLESKMDYVLFRKSTETMCVGLNGKLNYIQIGETRLEDKLLLVDKIKQRGLHLENEYSDKYKGHAIPGKFYTFDEIDKIKYDNPNNNESGYIPTVKNSGPSLAKGKYSVGK